MCHWAFDKGILRLDVSDTGREFEISIPDGIPAEADETGFDLADFAALAGPVPEERLPRNPDHWPNPTYINQFNREFYGV